MLPKAIMDATAKAKAKAKAKARVRPRQPPRMRALRSRGDSYLIPFQKSSTLPGPYLEFLEMYGAPHLHGVMVREKTVSKQIAKFFITCTEGVRAQHLARILSHGSPSMMRKIVIEYQTLKRDFTSMVPIAAALAVSESGVCVPVFKRRGFLID